MKTKKQQLQAKLKNVPRNASLVPCSTSSGLNRDQSLSDQNKVLTCNNSEENQLGNRRNTLLVVFVLNKEGKALMPCSPAKAKHLLKQGKARVIRCNPFTIQLLYSSGSSVQPITLGIDAGYSKIGFSAVTGKKELISGEVKLRNDVSKKLLEKKMYRIGRRNRLWYREARFDNRVSTKKERWLAPSINHKLDSHIRLVDKIKSLLPISSIIVEVASFDIQKIKNSNIEGKEYQHGERLGFYNTREYVLYRDNHICQHCKGKSKDKILQVHHIRGKIENEATNRPEELLTVCKTCHSKHHKGINIILIKEIKDFKPETFMSTIRWKLVNLLNCNYTYGYITKYNRIQSGLEKSHNNDAFIIAGNNDQLRSIQYSINQVRRNNRCLQLNRKGFKRSIRRQRYSFQHNDLVKFDSKIYEVKGVHSYGKYIRLKSEKDIDTNIENVNLYRYSRGLSVSYS